MASAKALRSWIYIGALLALASCGEVAQKKADGAAPPPRDEELSATAQDRSPALGSFQRNKNMAIPNGIEASPDEFPFAVSLGPDATTKLCGGTVVDAGWVLTAAHCRLNTFVVGRLFNPAGSVRVSAKAAARFCPPTFVEKTFKHDIALLAVPDPSFAALARVPRVPNDTWDQVGKPVTLIGWGLTGSGFPSKLMKGSARIHARLLCEQEYGNPPKFAFDLETFCTERGVNGTPSADSGDSGGPVLVNISGTPFQGGVISVGEGNTLPDRHIKLTKPLRDWIDNVIQDKGTTRQNSVCSHP